MQVGEAGVEPKVGTLSVLHARCYNSVGWTQEVWEQGRGREGKRSCFDERMKWRIECRTAYCSQSLYLSNRSQFNAMPTKRWRICTLSRNRDQKSRIVVEKLHISTSSVSQMLLTVSLMFNPHEFCSFISVRSYGPLKCHAWTTLVSCESFHQLLISIWLQGQIKRVPRYVCHLLWRKVVLIRNINEMRSRFEEVMRKYLCHLS